MCRYDPSWEIAVAVSKDARTKAYCFTLQATFYTRGGLLMSFQKLEMGLKYQISNVIVEEKHQPCRCLQLYRRHVFRKPLLGLFYDDF